MGLMCIAAEGAQSFIRKLKKRKPESHGTGADGAITKIGEHTKQGIYRANALEEAEIADLTGKLEVSYLEMADTLKDYGYTDVIPDKRTVMAAIMKLGPEMLKKISKFGKPTLLMTPAGDLYDKTRRIDENRKDAYQGTTYFGESPSSHLWGQAPAKLQVTIVDGAAEMPQLPAKLLGKSRWVRKLWLKEEYEKQGMKMISAYEYAMLAQRSLRSHKLAERIHCMNPEEEIIDKYTDTTFYCEKLNDLAKDPLGRWAVNRRAFVFGWNRPEQFRNCLRSRPSVFVMEMQDL